MHFNSTLLFNQLCKCRQIYMSSSQSSPHGHHVIYYRYACSISLDDHVVITGGSRTLTTVSRYEESGFVRNMPDLRQGRWGHGCTAFLSGGEQVRLET